MRAAVRAPLALVALLAPVLALGACSGSQETGTPIDPSPDGQPPAYEVVGEEPGDDGETDITVQVDEVPEPQALQAVAAEIQEERGDGVFDVEVVCATGGDDVADLRFATGDAALEESGLDEGEITIDEEPDAVCGTDG
jgi:hypothetical protein